MAAESENFHVRMSNTHAGERDTICDDSDETGGICMTIQLDSPGIERAEAAPSANDTDLGNLFDQIRDLDAHILEAVKRRSELSQQIGAAAKESGETREAQANEMGVLDRFAELGNDGKTLAMTLLRLGRTRRS